MSAPASRRSVGETIAAVLAAIVVGAVLSGSFALSVVTVMDTAPWGGVDPAMAALLPLSIDGLILAATVALVVARHRDQPTRRLWWMLGAGVAVSALINGAHAWTNGAAPHTLARILGVAMVAGAPVIAAAATHLLMFVLFGEREPTDDAGERTGEEASRTADTRTDTRADVLPLARTGIGANERTLDPMSTDDALDEGTHGEASASRTTDTRTDTGADVSADGAGRSRRRRARPGAVAEATPRILELADAGHRPDQIADEVGLGRTSVYAVLSDAGRT